MNVLAVELRKRLERAIADAREVAEPARERRWKRSRCTTGSPTDT